MSRPHPLTALSEREWAQAWEAEQRALDALDSNRGSWLPNVVETREWGALRWTSGRPAHAAATGRAAADSVAVFRPGLTSSDARTEILAALRDRPPVTRALGFGFRRHHLRGAAIGGGIGGVLAPLVAVILRFEPLLIIAALVLGAAAGAAIGVAVMHFRFQRHRADVLGNTNNVRVIAVRHVTPAFLRLVEAATHLAAGTRGSEPHPQTREALHLAMWSAAELVQEKSDHTGIEVLAADMERLARAERGA